MKVGEYQQHQRQLVDRENPDEHQVDCNAFDPLFYYYYFIGDWKHAFVCHLYPILKHWCSVI